MEPKRYDPETTDTAENARKNRLIGWWGPFPSTPCTYCGGEFFVPVGDWSLGYRCARCDRAWQEPK